MTFRKAEKIIGRVHPRQGPKVGFKLETSLTSTQMRDIAKDYMDKYNLTLMVFNLLADVDENRHVATIFENGGGEIPVCHEKIEGKAPLARFIVDHVGQCYANPCNQ